MAGEFERLLKLVRDGLQDTRRTGDPIPDVRLEFRAGPGQMAIRIKLGEDDFIPDVAEISHTQNSGGFRSHDAIAADLLDELALRALRVGRTKEEQRGH